jgi:hypothetical protein
MIAREVSTPPALAAATDPYRAPLPARALLSRDRGSA